MSDDEIEFLDEDADIVQQCVQSVQYQLLEPKLEPVDDEEPPVHVIHKLHASHTMETSQRPLLIERRPPVVSSTAVARKRKKVEDDIDYDPIVDSPYRNRKRRHQRFKQSNQIKQETSSRSSVQSQSPPFYAYKKKQVVNKVAQSLTQSTRRSMSIRVPDFDDPLCLPVRALIKDDRDSRRLRHWNYLCLEQFKKNDLPLRPREDSVSSSKRTVLIRNMFSKYSGKSETTFWSKVTVSNKEGRSRSDVVQAVLPRYREKKVLHAYKLKEPTERAPRHTYEVILTKENYGDEETLVAYKPDESLSMVFKMMQSEGRSAGGAESPDEGKRYLQEVASCTACARCYQASWRANETADTGAEVRTRCPVCARAYASAAALLAHAKTHPAAVRALRRGDLSQALAKMLPYHYECRICQEQFLAIRDLRRHLAEHRGLGKFFCEVGNHLVC